MNRIYMYVPEEGTSLVEVRYDCKSFEVNVEIKGLYVLYHLLILFIRDEADQFLAVNCCEAQHLTMQ